jgi:CRP-like cAMP-binding protein
MKLRRPSDHRPAWPSRPETTAQVIPSVAIVRSSVVPISLDPTQADLFRRLPSASLARLLMLSRASTFEAGGALLRCDRRSGCLFVIATGRVRVQWLCPQFGRMATLGDIGPGETVGELGIVDEYQPALTVVALENTTAWLVAHAAVALMMLYDAETRAVLGSRLAARRRAFEVNTGLTLRQESVLSTIAD